MGQSGQTLGQQGCLITASASAAFAFAKQTNPLVLCRQMSQAGGFDQTGSANLLTLAKCLGLDLGFRYDTNANVAPNHSQVNEAMGLLHIERLAKWGMPSVIWVDTDHDGKPNHWVCYLGQGQVLDPWDGQQKGFDAVFKRLYGYFFFVGQPAWADDSVGVLIGKANEIYDGRNVVLNAKEIMDTVKRP